MPYGMRKLPNGKYRVYNKDTGKVHAKATSKANAVAQIRIMQAADAGESFVSKSKRKHRRI
jgi:hypothetical protein